MNLSQINAIFLFHPFRHLFALLFDPLSLGQCDQKAMQKPAEKLKKSNKCLNSG